MKKQNHVVLSPLQNTVIDGLGKSAITADKATVKIFVESDSSKSEEEKPSLVKSILNILNGGGSDSIERLAFEQDPTQGNQYHSVYRDKVKLLPDSILKRMAIQDDLVSSIVLARCNQVSVFGRPRPDRFSTGFIVDANHGVRDNMSDDQKEELHQRIEKVVQKLWTCGETKGWNDQEKLSLPEFLYQSTRNAIVVGRIATEVVWATNPDGTKKFHSFRPIDAGTIYRAVPQQTALESVRRQARNLLEQLHNEKLIPERFQNDDYVWVQVVENRPLQAFTSDECLVHNFYPVTDVELGGYPVTPLDTVISAVVTHINITTHNKLYFQNGRASKGMLVIQSDEVDESVVQRVRQQFNASVNSVQNSFRMPVFSIGSDSQVVWTPIDTSNRDMEFTYLSDMNARVILSAFQMSPEELPGYAHLSRGTNSQALSESGNEFRLEAHRDLGIRPLLAQFENFLNSSIFPLLDPELAKICTIKLVGLDADTAEKESVRLQQDMAVHLTYSDVLERVEKKSIDKELGGNFPLNPVFQQVLDKYLPVGVILEKFFGIEGASKDPQYAYLRDPFWFQWQGVMQQQAMLQQQLAAVQSQANQQPQEEPQDLNRSITQAEELLSKSEASLSPSRRRLLAQQKKTLQHFLEGWEDDLKDVTKTVLNIADKHKPRGK